MPAHLDTGRQGEDLAARLLLQKGYELVARNYRVGKGEVDLIVKKEGLLVFVEVKTRTNLTFGHPEEAVSRRKAMLVVRAADEYIFRTDWRGNIRLDIVAVVFNRGQPSEVAHFEDAFF